MLFIVKVSSFLDNEEFVAGSMWEAKQYVSDLAYRMSGIETYILDTYNFASFEIHGVLNVVVTGTITKQ